MNSQKKPLLYIHQPRMNEVKSSMQDVFRGSSKVTQPKKERIIPQQIETKRRTELYEAAPLGSLKQAEYHPVRKIEKDAVDPIRKKESLGIEPSREDNSASKETRQHQGQLGKDPSYDGYFKPLTPL
ncbi:hypothetical protein QTG56_19715 [Rossellomorea sp. AcN35-11]|nr:hypothetical protein QTG56_19715 [Rossellomorea sp. AcN35-11]